jgi:hypothetical protein
MAVNEVIAAPRPTNDIVPVTPPRRRVLAAAAVIAAYFSLGLAAYWPALPGISHQVFSVDGDLTLTVWFLGWVPHAIAHGLNPFFSNAMYVPTGLNLAQSTEGPLLGLVAAPITLAFGPLVTANLLMVLSMPASASAAFVVFRKWQVWWPAAALGGLAYGFSPYMVGQAIGHPVLMFLPLPPFIVLTVVSILQRRGRPRRLGIQLGVLVAAQYLISQELLATVVVLTITALAFIALRNPMKIAELARVAIVPIGIALVVASALLAFPVWMLLAGPQHVSGPTYPLLNPYHADLLSFVVHGPLQKVSLGMQTSWTGGFWLWDPTEAGGYVGVPVLILIGSLAWRSRHSARMQLSVATFLSSVLLSLGPYLAVHGRATRIPLPFWLLGHLPLIDNVLPIRVSFEIGACLAAMIAFGLDDLRRAPVRDDHRGHTRQPWAHGRRPVIIASLALVVLVVTQLPQWPYVATPAVVIPASLRQAVPTGNPVAITYPYTYGSTNVGPLLWQAEDGFRFRLLGGYGFHRGTSGNGTVLPNPMSPPGLQELLAFEEGYYGPIPVTPELVATTRMTLSKYDVRLIIVDHSAPRSGAVMDLFDQALGAARVSKGQFSLWANWRGAPRQ